MRREVRVKRRMEGGEAKEEKGWEVRMKGRT
jgi:hypothetical protein